MKISVNGRSLLVKEDKVVRLTKKKNTYNSKGDVVCRSRGLAFYLSIYITSLCLLIPILWFLAPVSLIIFFMLGRFYNPFDLKFDSSLYFSGYGEVSFDYKFDLKASSNVKVVYKYPVYLIFVRYFFNVTGLFFILGLLLYYYFTLGNVLVLATAIAYSVIMLIIFLIYTITLVKRYKVYKSLDGMSYEDYLLNKNEEDSTLEIN